MPWIRTARTRRLATAQPRAPFWLNANWPLAQHAAWWFSGHPTHGHTEFSVPSHLNLGYDQGAHFALHVGSPTKTMRAIYHTLGDSKHAPIPGIRWPRSNTSEDYYEVQNTSNADGYTQRDYTIGLMYNVEAVDTRQALIGRDTGFFTGQGLYIEGDGTPAPFLRFYHDTWNQPAFTAADSVVFNVWQFASAVDDQLHNGELRIFLDGAKGTTRTEGTTTPTTDASFLLGSLGTGGAPLTNRLAKGYWAHAFFLDRATTDEEQYALAATFDGRWDCYEEYGRRGYFFTPAAGPGSIQAIKASCHASARSAALAMTAASASSSASSSAAPTATLTAHSSAEASARSSAFVTAASGASGAVTARAASTDMDAARASAEATGGQAGVSGPGTVAAFQANAQATARAAGLVTAAAGASGAVTARAASTDMDAARASAEATGGQASVSGPGTVAALRASAQATTRSAAFVQPAAGANGVATPRPSAFTMPALAARGVATGNRAQVGDGVDASIAHARATARQATLAAWSLNPAELQAHNDLDVFFDPGLTPADIEADLDVFFGDFDP